MQRKVMSMYLYTKKRALSDSFFIFVLRRERDSLAQFFCAYRSRPVGRDKSPRPWVWEGPVLFTKRKGAPFLELLSFLRRERDSNPRSLSAQRFSRPPQSTTLPSLLEIGCKGTAFFWYDQIFYKKKTAEAVFFRIFVDWIRSNERSRSPYGVARGRSLDTYVNRTSCRQRNPNDSLPRRRGGYPLLSRGQVA